MLMPCGYSLLGDAQRRINSRAKAAVDGMETLLQVDELRRTEQCFISLASIARGAIQSAAPYSTSGAPVT